MKKILLILIVTFFNLNVFSQAPQQISYQAIVRNSSNELLQNASVSAKVSIIIGNVNGEVTYVETHNVQTNVNGLINLKIGGGTAISGQFFNAIFWGQPNFIKIEIDPLGGTNYTIVSTSEVLSVPNANYARVSGTLEGSSADFIGAYLQTSGTDAVFNGYCFITYLSPNQVKFTYRNFDNDFPVGGSVEFIAQDNSLFANTFGNTITFPIQGTGQNANTSVITGTKIGNVITIIDPDGFEITLTKQ